MPGDTLTISSDKENLSLVVEVVGKEKSFDTKLTRGDRSLDVNVRRTTRHLPVRNSSISRILDGIPEDDDLEDDDLEEEMSLDVQVVAGNQSLQPRLTSSAQSLRVRVKEKPRIIGIPEDDETSLAVEVVGGDTKTASKATDFLGDMSLDVEVRRPESSSGDLPSESEEHDWDRELGFEGVLDRSGFEGLGVPEVSVILSEPEHDPAQLKAELSLKREELADRLPKSDADAEEKYAGLRSQSKEKAALALNNDIETKYHAARAASMQRAEESARRNAETQAYIDQLTNFAAMSIATAERELTQTAEPKKQALNVLIEKLEKTRDRIDNNRGVTFFLFYKTAVTDEKVKQLNDTIKRFKEIKENSFVCSNLDLAAEKANLMQNKSITSHRTILSFGGKSQTEKDIESAFAAAEKELSRLQNRESVPRVAAH